jgi:elongator complex protein 3
LEKEYWSGDYKPYAKEQTIKIITLMLKAVPEYCRVMRVMREIPPEYLIAGIVNIDLRKDIEENLRKEKVKLKEIRYRESGFALRDKRDLDLNLRIKTINYSASGAKEFFLEVVNKENILFGLLRLRINRNCGVIRELHVYGKSLGLGEKSKIAPQHQGLGKLLMETAENICKKNNGSKTT